MLKLPERARMAHALHERVSGFSRIVAKFRNGDLTIFQVREDMELQMEYLQDQLNNFVKEVKERDATTIA